MGFQESSLTMNQKRIRVLKTGTASHICLYHFSAYPNSRERLANELIPLLADSSKPFVAHTCQSWHLGKFQLPLNFFSKLLFCWVLPYIKLFHLRSPGAVIFQLLRLYKKCKHVFCYTLEPVLNLFIHLILKGKSTNKIKHDFVSIE